MTLRTDTHFPTGTEGLTNARTRIVGNRTGFFADAVITVVRFFRAVRMSASHWLARVASVVTPLGWAMVILVPIGLVAGYAFNWVELVVVAYAGVC